MVQISLQNSGGKVVFLRGGSMEQFSILTILCLHQVFWEALFLPGLHLSFEVMMFSTVKRPLYWYVLLSD